MNVRRKVSGAAVAGLMLIPVLTLAQVGPGQGPGMPSETAPSGGSMMMQMMGMTGMMGGMGPGAGGQPTMMGQMSQMMQRMAEMQKRLSEMMGAPQPEKK